MKLTMTAYERDQLTPEARKRLDGYLSETSSPHMPTHYTYRLDGLEFENLMRSANR